MKRFIEVNEEQRLTGIADSPFENVIEIDIEEDHEANLNPFIYRYEDGQLVKDTEYQKELIKQRESLKSQPTTKEIVQEIRGVNEAQNVALAEILELQQKQLNEVKLAIVELANTINTPPEPEPGGDDEQPESV